MMTMIRLVKLASLIVCLSSLSGCTGVKMERGAVAEDGVLKNGIHGIEPGAFQQPVVDVKEGAVKNTVTGPLIEVKERAISGPLVAEGAAKFTIEKDAFHFESGAIVININVIPQKPPSMDPTVILDNLKTLQPVGDIGVLPVAQQNLIRDNVAKLHAAVQAFLKMIADYNTKYATPFEPEKK